MKKLYPLFFLGIILSYSGCSDLLQEDVADNGPLTRTDTTQDYYYFFDEKVYIEKYAEYVYVIFEEDKFKNLQTKLSSFSEFDTEFRQINYRGFKENVHKAPSSLERKKLMSATFKAVEIESVIKHGGEVYYQIPFYKTIDGAELVFSNVFYVYLKNDAQVTELEELALEYSLDILGVSPTNSLWWTLACTGDSAGNALEMANAFFETGRFQACEPDCVSINTCQGIDPLSIHQWNLPAINFDFTYGESSAPGF